MATVPGIDVSYWNAGIDWPKVRATGQRFVFAKATEGDFYADPSFDDNWRDLVEAAFNCKRIIYSRACLRQSAT